jgi:uncharacterized damage-inducible protein DinB
MKTPIQNCRNIFLTVTILICLIFSSYATPPSTQELIADWKRAKEYTKEYLDAMPADGTNYKPNPEIRSFSEQMLHIAAANYGFGATASGKKPPLDPMQLEKNETYKNKEALSKIVLESYDFVINALSEFDEKQFPDKVKFFDFDLTKEQAFRKAFEHQTHHRGQATIYLRMKGVKPPQEKLF